MTGGCQHVHQGEYDIPKARVLCCFANTSLFISHSGDSVAEFCNHTASNGEASARNLLKIRSFNYTSVFVPSYLSLSLGGPYWSHFILWALAALPEGFLFLTMKYYSEKSEQLLSQTCFSSGFLTPWHWHLSPNFSRTALPFMHWEQPQPSEVRAFLFYIWRLTLAPIQCCCCNPQGNILLHTLPQMLL